MFKKYPIEAQFLVPTLPSCTNWQTAPVPSWKGPEVCLITTDWEPQIPVLTIE